MQRITVLGSTGSIGVSTLDVVARHPERYQIFALSAYSKVAQLAEQCQQFKPQVAVVGSATAAAELEKLLQTHSPRTTVLWGEAALCQIASATECDAVMAAIVGAAGLAPTLAAAQAGKRVLLANKESLVMSGALFMQAVQQSGAVLLPIDSEHNAIFQCLPQSPSHNKGIAKIILTASGGPFRTRTLESLADVTVEQAVAHPKWVMGQKISVDSATMMNKGLEVIEAHWLFDAPADKIEVLIHPQSIVHSMVSYTDGSVLAQMGNPDMRTPIAYGLAWPERIESGVAALDLTQHQLEFYKPDIKRFKALALAYQALCTGGILPCVLNAANEVAVDAFLNRKLSFLSIAETIERVLNSSQWAELQTAQPNLAQILSVDAQARHMTHEILQTLT